MSARHTGRSGIAAAALAAIFMALAPLRATAQEPVRFAIQAWPGVTVKTEVARQLLGAMGYESTLRELSPQFVYEGIRGGDVDVSLGAWMPAHKDMVQPLLDEGAAIKFAPNLEGAIQGLAVPTYVEGVDSVEDLVEHGEKFNKTIYAIGSGAAMTRAFQDAVKSDYKGLGDWKVVPSSVAGMMSQVDRATRKEEPVVFHGWKPHWMVIEYDLRFLKDDPDQKIADMKTVVWTIVADGWPDENPQVAKFLEQFEVSVEAQSKWIDGFTRQERDPGPVATAWIESNMDTVEQWVQGVKTADGGSGVEAVREKFGG